VQLTARNMSKIYQIVDSNVNRSTLRFSPITMKKFEEMYEKMIDIAIILLTVILNFFFFLILEFAVSLTVEFKI
jgi:hypothetical protein